MPWVTTCMCSFRINLFPNQSFKLSKLKWDGFKYDFPKRKERKLPKNQEMYEQKGTKISTALYHFPSNKVPKRCVKWGAEHDCSSESGRIILKLEIYKFTIGI